MCTTICSVYLVSNTWAYHIVLVQLTATVSLLRAEYFPTLTLPCYALVRVLGTLHFLSSQVPLGLAGTVVGS